MDDDAARGPKPEFDLIGAQWYGVKGDPDGPQVAFMPDGHVVLRHGSEPDGPTLVYTASEWEAFRLGAADGEFTDLAKHQHVAE